MRFTCVVLLYATCEGHGHSRNVATITQGSLAQTKQLHSHGRTDTRKFSLLDLLLLSFHPTARGSTLPLRQERGLSGIQTSMLSFESAEKQVARQLEAQGRKDVKVNSRSEITADGKAAFWKIGTGGSTANVELLQYEAEGLARMADASEGLLTVPRPWIVGEVELAGSSSGYIVMDMLKSGSVPDRQRKLGLGLAAMHSAPPPSDWEPDVFGFPINGCCGAFSQPNNVELKKLNWIDFWIEFRLKHQLRGIRDSEADELGNKIIEIMPKLFPFPIDEIKPSLLHGDLWSGNHGSDGNTGLPTLFDPACYYGHDEADFGIAHMFGGLGQEFYDAYFSVRPKKPGFEQRAILYELHHHLNHYNIFGGGYLASAKNLMRKLIREAKAM